MEAAKASEIVVVTIPLKNYREVPVAPLAGKIVIDTNNYYPQRDGHIAELDNESTTTAELLQAHLPTSKVVKAFNHIYAAELTTHGQPAGLKNRRALVIAGDDAAAKAVVTKLLDELVSTPWMPGPCEKDGAFNAIRRATAHVARQRNCARTWRRPSDTPTVERLCRSLDLRRPVQGLWPPTIAATFLPRCATGCAWNPRGVACNRQEEAALSRPV